MPHVVELDSQLKVCDGEGEMENMEKRIKPNGTF